MNDTDFLTDLNNAPSFEQMLDAMSYEDMVDILQTDSEKVASLLTKTITNTATAASPLMTGARKAVGHGLQAATTAGAGTRMAVGAGVGAAAGAMKDTGVNPQTGQQVGRMGNILGGAALGATAGYHAQGAVAKGLAMPNAAGSAMRVAQGGVAKATGNQVSAQAVQAGKKASNAVRKPA